MNLLQKCTMKAMKQLRNGLKMRNSRTDLKIFLKLVCYTFRSCFFLIACLIVFVLLVVFLCLFFFFGWLVGSLESSSIHSPHLWDLRKYAGQLSTRAYTRES